MTITFRRILALATAVFMAAGSIAPEAYAQGATVGGTPSATAPANTGGAPAANPAAAPTGDEAAPRPRRRRHRHRRAHHRASAPVGTQSQDGASQ